MRVNLSVTGKELKDMEKAFQRYALTKRKAIERLVEDVSMNAAADAKNDAPVNVGTLRRNVRYRVIEGRGGLKVTGEIESASNYSTAVEYGRSPGTLPPVGDGSKEGILYWVRRKGIARSWSTKTKRMTRRTKAQEQAEIQMAWAIAKKIEKFGTKPQPFMRPAHEKWSKIFQAKLYEILRR